ncbi:interferon-induced GTP-binding protein Mx2-like isoform X2 [Tiliqua scincoides]|uniref:interferon-induced GTP-binding protein Mx2-like isoform X2 n=1 Tax=Tiliqua scincoides TaxID=71010 RepID=UPI00346379C0
MTSRQHTPPSVRHRKTKRSEKHSPRETTSPLPLEGSFMNEQPKWNFIRNTLLVSEEQKSVPSSAMPSTTSLPENRSIDLIQAQVEKDYLKHLEVKMKKTEHTLYNQYEEKIRPCIDLIDSLRALGVEKDLALPAIAVIGDQSSGKSSVLEALSGVSLPRGSGIVTRCPLALKLKKTCHGQEWKGKISYQDIDEELQNPSEVEKEIRKAQNAMAGEGVGISHELITLEIRSPEVPDLTLIDLPGIARVAVGNQPQDIGDQIKRLIKTFIAKQETINLVVVPSNVDIATTEALKMAQEVDPDGERTLGVLTKPDLVDKGTEEVVVDVVRNIIIHLKKGYMIVKCRGQQDIQDNVPLSSAIQKERAFFEDHEHFSALLEGKKATIPLLAEKLTSELVEHINKSLPDLEEQINSQLQKANEEFRKYGRRVPNTEGEKLYFLIDKLKLFNEDIANTAQGEEELSGDDARLLTKIRKEFQAWGKTLDQSAKQVRKDIYDEVWRFEEQYRGRELPGFVNYKTFEAIIKQQIAGLEEPAVEMLKKVTDTVRQAFTEVAKQHFVEFHNLYKAAKNRIEDIKEKQAEEAEATVRTQFAMEQILYCQDGIYSQDLDTVREQTEKVKRQEAATKGFAIIPAKENASFAEMAYHLKAYFNSAGKRLSCQIPLIVQFYMLKKYGAQLQNEMLKLLQEKEELNTLLQEQKDTAEKKQFLSERISRLTKARHQLAIFPA